MFNTLNQHCFPSRTLCIGQSLAFRKKIRNIQNKTKSLEENADKISFWSQPSASTTPSTSTYDEWLLHCLGHICGARFINHRSERDGGTLHKMTMFISNLARQPGTKISTSGDLSITLNFVIIEDNIRPCWEYVIHQMLTRVVVLFLRQRVVMEHSRNLLDPYSCKATSPLIYRSITL